MTRLQRVCQMVDLGHSVSVAIKSVTDRTTPIGLKQYVADKLLFQCTALNVQSNSYIPRV